MAIEEIGGLALAFTFSAGCVVGYFVAQRQCNRSIEQHTGKIGEFAKAIDQKLSQYQITSKITPKIK